MLLYFNKIQFVVVDLINRKLSFPVPKHLLNIAKVIIVDIEY